MTDPMINLEGSAIPSNADIDDSLLLHRLSTNDLLCIIDFLAFPDAFALALSCKSLYVWVDLKQKKQQYRNDLKQVGASLPWPSSDEELGFLGSYRSDRHDLEVTPLTALCDVCLYALPPTSFPGLGPVRAIDLWILILQRRALTRETICLECSKFRIRIRQAPGTGLGWTVPWRPSRKISVEGTGGALWYRKCVDIKPIMA